MVERINTLTGMRPSPGGIRGEVEPLALSYESGVPESGME